MLRDCHSELPEELHLTLPEDQAVLLFQSVRELLINPRNMQDRRSHVTVECLDDQLRIEVRYEGAGFEVAATTAASHIDRAPSFKFGLLSIMERIAGIGEDSFDLQSAPGQGVTATLLLPLSQEDQTGA
jgi:signal transduction histidine kinase